MWSLLPQKMQVLILAGGGILIAWTYDVVAKFFNAQQPSVFKGISVAVFIIATATLFIAEWSWRWFWKKIPLLQRLVFPDLNGVWKGNLVSTWIDPTTGQPKPPIPTEITIRQGLLSTSVSLKTGESYSYSTRAFLEPYRATRRYRISYNYCNAPKAALGHRSAPHDGSAYLELDLDGDENHLTGSYFTSRKTTGDLSVKR
jgi:hypothetical protein